MFLDPHHVQKRSQGGADHLDNLAALCRRCHDLTDAPYAKGRLVVTPLGGQRFRFVRVWVADKFVARGTFTNGG